MANDQDKKQSSTPVHVRIDVQDEEENTHEDAAREPIYVMGSVTHSYIQYNDNSLNIIHERSNESNDRPIIPCSLINKVVFVSYYNCSFAKLLVRNLTADVFKKTVWAMTFGMCLVALPFWYIDLFYSVYAPHHHLYLSQMSPLFCGTTIQNIIASVVALLRNFDILIRLLAYNINGMMELDPWGECPKDHLPDTIITIDKGKTIAIPTYCISVNQFNEIPKEDVLPASMKYYETNNMSFLIPAPIIYYSVINDKFNEKQFYQPDVLFYYIFIWAIFPFFRGQLYKKTIWRVFGGLLCIMCIIHFLTILCITYVFYAENLKTIKIKEEEENEENNSESLMFIITYYVFELASGSVVAPPIIHFIYSRSKTEVWPGSCSAAMAVCSVLYSLLQEIARIRCTQFIESKANITTHNFEGIYPFLYEYPVLSTNLTIGPLLFKVFLLTLFLLEYITMVIAFQTIVEVVLSEWKILNYWIVAVATSIVGLLFVAFTSFEMRRVHHEISILTTTFIKMFVIFCMYPIMRLFQDVDFYYYNDFITSLRKWSIAIALLVMSLICATRALILNVVIKHNFRVIKMIVSYLLPIFVGFICIVVYAIVKKKNWRFLLTPLPTWGPQDPTVRRFRKKFNSDEFIDSLADRDLSRHMLQRAEPSCYRLEVQYPNIRRRSKENPL